MGDVIAWLGREVGEWGAEGHHLGAAAAPCGDDGVRQRRVGSGPRDGAHLAAGRACLALEAAARAQAALASEAPAVASGIDAARIGVPLVSSRVRARACVRAPSFWPRADQSYAIANAVSWLRCCPRVPGKSAWAEHRWAHLTTWRAE